MRRGGGRQRRKGGAEDSTAARGSTIRGMRRPPRARRLRLSQLSLRRWPLWLVAAALLLGTLPVHSDLERHGAIGAPTHVWLEQCPPGTARHLEASTSVEVPRCVACLLQLQGKGALLAAPRQLGALVL